MSALILAFGHISEASRQILSDRDRGPRGRSFFNGGDRAAPIMTDWSFGLDQFSQLWSNGKEARIQRAMPYDLLFLHHVAVENGFDELIIGRQGEHDERLPWYGDTGNKIRDLGSMLIEQKDEIRLAHRRARHDPDAGPIEAILPRLLREKKLTLKLEEVTPSPDSEIPELY